MPEQNTKPPTPPYSHRHVELEDSSDFSKYKEVSEFLNRVGFELISTGFATGCYVRLDGTGVELRLETSLLKPTKLKMAIALPRNSKFLEELVKELPETEEQIRR